MAAEDRSFSDVVQDILRNVQEIVRSEVRLAKTEIREEAVKAKILGGIARRGRDDGYLRNSLSAAYDCFCAGSRHADLGRCADRGSGIGCCRRPSC